MSVFGKYADCLDCVICDKQHPLFGNLTEEELGNINATRFEVDFKSGEILFKQGTPATHVICLTSGLVKLYVEGPNDKNLILKLACPTEIFGGPGAFVDNRHHYTARAIEDSKACFVDLVQFKALVKKNTAFASEFITGISNDAIFTNDRFFSLSYKQMHGRVAEILLYLSQNVYKANPFKMTVSRSDLAELTALSRESVIRILKEFKEDGIVTFNGDELYQLDIPRLEKLSIIS